MAILNPSPRSRAGWLRERGHPRRGRRTSRKRAAPSCPPSSPRRPGVSRGTTKADKPLCARDRSVDANTVYWEACAPFVMKHFRPFSTYPSPSRASRRGNPAGGPSPTGSVRQKEANRNSVANGWTNARFCSPVPARRIGPSAEGVGVHRTWRRRAPQEISSSRMHVSNIVSPCPP